MRYTIILIMLSLGLTSCATGPNIKTNFTSEDTPAITTAVFDYFHGQGEASEERMNRAFATEHAKMAGVYKDKEGNEYIKSFDMAKIIPNWAANKNPVGGTRDGEILNIEIVDDRLAVVTFRSTDRFYDALTLVKVNGKWKIVAKAFIRQ